MNSSSPELSALNLRPSLLNTTLRRLWRSSGTRGAGAWGVLAGTLPGLAAAGPGGEQVVAGDVAVNRPDARHTIIDQASSKAILNWQQFSIGGDEFVQFNQPGSSAVALNRVVGGDVSHILGSLSANGQVFLVNPRGIYFGPNATVDVGGLVASIMDIRDEDFLAGRYTFSRHDDSPAGAAVVNDGYIRAREGGYVVLAGDYTANAGVVEARLGQVVLASGSRMTLDLEGDGLVSFAVDEAVLGELAGVENSGELLADGGRVVMTARVADELMGSAVNNAGLVRAHSVAEHGGEIYLTAAGGDIVNGGALDADAGDGEAGGRVRVLSDRDIELPAGGTITARGDGDGSGGDVRVVANDRLAFRLDHTIDVQGGAPNRGGFVEVSGHGGLQLAGTLRLGGGRVVIDPDKIIIRDGNGSPSGSLGSAGTSVIFEEYLENLLAGNSYGSGADIRLVADQGIEMEALGDGVLDGTNPSGTFSGGDLSLFIGSAGDAGGPASSYGVFNDGGSFFLNDNDPTASIVLNADVRVDGDFIAVTGRDAYGNGGYGTISLQNVTAGYGSGFGRQILIGVEGEDSFFGSSDPKTAAVTAGQLTVDGAEGRVRIRAEDTVNVAGIATQQGSVIVDTGAVGATGSVNITGGVTGRDIALGFDPQNSGSPANALSVAVGGTITASPSCCSDATVEVRAEDSIDLANINVTQDVGSGFTTRVLVAGGGTAVVSVGDVMVRSGSGGSGGMADIQITGNGVTTGTLTAEGFGGSPSTGAQIRVTGNGGDVDIAGLEATAHNGHDASINVDAYGGGVDDLSINGAVSATGMNAYIDITYDGDLTVNGAVTATGTSGNASIDVFGDDLGSGIRGDVSIGGLEATAQNGHDAHISMDAYGTGAGHDLSVVGAATATGMNADIFINNFTDGDITVNGTVTASGTSGDASIGMFGSGSGAVTAGNLVASGVSAAMDVRGTRAVTVGDASAAASNGAADLFVRSTTNNGGAVETGNLTAAATAAETDATIFVTGYGAVTTANLTATADSDADVTARTFGTGAVAVGEVDVAGGDSAFANIDGDGAVMVSQVVLAGATAEAILSVRGGGAQTVSVGDVTVDGGTSAEVNIEHGGTGPLAVGNVNATASYGDADVNIWDSGTGTVTVGDISASGTSASIDVWGSGGAVTVGNVTATGTSRDADVDIWTSGAGAVTVGDIAATGTSASASVWGSDAVTVGNVDLSGTGGNGHLDVWSNGTGATVTVGDVNVAGAGSYGNAFVHIWGSSGATITVGNVMATGNSASASISRFGSGTGAISVGHVTAEAGGSGDARIRVDGAEGGSAPGDVATGRLTAMAGSASDDTASIFVNGRDIATQDLLPNGAVRRLHVFGRDIKVASAGGIDLGSSGSIEASRGLTMVAQQGDITNAYGNMIQADAIALAAPNGSILLPGTRIYVGDGIARDLGGNPLLADAELINTLQQNAGQIFEGAEAASESLNAFFQAGEQLVLGSVPQGDAGDYQLVDGSVTDGINVANGYLALQLGIGSDIDGDSVPDENNKSGYAWFEGRVIGLGPVVGEAANIIVQWASPNDFAISGDAAPDALTQLEQSTTYLTVPDHFSRFSGTTHAPGFSAHPLSAASPAVPGTPTGPYIGNVDIAGTVGLGDANFFLLTGGSTTGLENIQTTGLVALINVLGTPPEEPPPEEPPPPDDTGDDAADSEEGELEDLVEEDIDDPESPDTSPRGDEALARVCQ